MSTTKFTKWTGDEGIEHFIKKETKCKPYSGSGINIRLKNKTAILRSVDGVDYYDDDMSNTNCIKYTLFGPEGDQDEHESRFNKPLLDKTKIKNIYVYRVKKNGRKNEYIWYGKYKIIDKRCKIHKGKSGIMRNIIVLTLEK